MRVIIGPYKEWIGPYQLAEMLLFWMDKYEDDRVHNFGTWLAGGKDQKSFLSKACSWLDSKKKRKMKIHIDKWDTWNMDSTLSPIILPMLKQLKATKHGSPMCSPYFDQTSNSAQYSFDFYADGDEAAWNAGHQAWEDIMDKMIWSFEQLQPDYDWEDQYTLVKPELDMKKYPEDEGKMVVPVRWKVQGVTDWDARRKHQERIDEGLKLFGEYYQSLWD